MTFLHLNILSLCLSACIFSPSFFPFFSFQKVDRNGHLIPVNRNTSIKITFTKLVGIEKLLNHDFSPLEYLSLCLSACNFSPSFFPFFSLQKVDRNGHLIPMNRSTSIKITFTKLVGLEKLLNQDFNRVVYGKSVDFGGRFIIKIISFFFI